MNEGLKYNTQREKMTIPEYGRAVQQMIHHLFEIDDRTKRTEAANFIVSIMAQMNPQVKDRDDYLHKLWDHMFLIAGQDLDVDSPYGQPNFEVQTEAPEKLDYNKNEIDFGHYGKYLMEMIERVAAMDEGHDRDIIAFMLANQMKRSYLNWSKSSVNDQLILNDLKRISKGRIILPEETKLIHSSEILGKTMMPAQKQKKNNQKKQGNNKQNHNRKPNKNN